MDNGVYMRMEHALMHAVDTCLDRTSRSCTQHITPNERGYITAAVATCLGIPCVSLYRCPFHVPQEQHDTFSTKIRAEGTLIHAYVLDGQGLRTHAVDTDLNPNRRLYAQSHSQSTYCFHKSVICACVCSSLCEVVGSRSSQGRMI